MTTTEMMMMTYYIQRRDKDGELETVDEFEDQDEAEAMKAEYNFAENGGKLNGYSDGSGADYIIQYWPTEGWND